MPRGEKTRELWKKDNYRDIMKNKHKGKHSSPKTEFLKGQVPWNKGLKIKRKTFPFKCEKCGKYTEGRYSGQRYCSRSCRAMNNKWNVGRKATPDIRKKLSLAARKGEKNHLWKGGITKENHKIRESFEYKEWRNSVFVRDNFTCKMCFEVGGKLEAHHIESFAQKPERRFDIDNGITLCKNCHSKIDKYRRIGK